MAEEVKNYLNEFDPFVAEWLRGLMRDGQIPAATVDERSIKDVKATDLAGFRQCHFFAGIGGWPLAFRLAGLPESVNAWSGSCPCQPFSAAGKGKGTDDARHLWPVWFPLIRECRPEYVFGEQVSAAIGHGWLDGVFADMEAAGYTGGGIVLGAHSVRSPHIRQRLFWGFRRNGGLSKSNGLGHNWREDSTRPRESLVNYEDEAIGVNQRLFNSHVNGRIEGQSATEAARYRDSADTAGSGLRNSPSDNERRERESGQVESIATGGPGSGLQHAATSWSDYTIGHYRDGKSRRVGSGVQPLAHGIPAAMGRPRAILEGMGYGPKDIKRMLRRPGSLLAMARRNRTGRLKGYGNAIVPQVAAVFIRAFMETAS